MRVLLDEHIPIRYRHDIVGHEVMTVEYMGWKGLENGDLLSLADPEFDVLVTADRELAEGEETARLRRMSIVLVEGPRITLEMLRSATRRVLAAIGRTRTASLERVEV